MQNFGIEVAQGSEIVNLTIPSGTSFPANDNVGEMFYRTDEDKLYVRNNTTWDVVTTSSGAIFVKADGTVEMSGALVLSGNPTLDNHAATKTYVDGLVTGLDAKASVHVATTANIALTGTLTIDGVLTTANDRVLVKNQTDATENGIYDVQAGSWVRSSDADNSPTNEVSGGMYCFVEEGTINGDTGWTMASPSGDAVLGTDDLDFVKFSNVTAPVSSVAGKTGAITLVEADISDFNNYLRSDASGTMTGTMTISNGSPGIIFQETDQALDEKQFYMVVNSGLLQIQERTDVGGYISTLFKIDRSGNFETLGNITENGTLLTSKYLGITAKAADSDKLDNFDSSQFIRSDTNDQATGNHQFSGTDTSGNYSNAPIEIREVNLVTTSQTSEAYAPAITYHWGSTAQGQLALESDSIFRFRDGTTHSTLKTVDAGDLRVNGSSVYHIGNPPPSSDGTNPSGTIISVGASSLPAGYIKCNGAAVSRTTYATLFAYIGTVYGVGNGSTTFNIPDLRGEFLRGWDDSRGVDSGRSFGSFQADEFKSHNHSLPMWQNSTEKSQHTGGAGVATTFGQTAKFTVGTGGSETRPRNVAVMYVIKY